MKITNVFLRDKLNGFFCSAKEKMFVFEVVQTEEFLRINYMESSQRRGFFN